MNIAADEGSSPRGPTREEDSDQRPEALAATIAQLEREVAERQRIEAELRLSEARYRMLVRNFPNGTVFLFDHDLRYLVADGEGLRVVGMSPEMLEGRTIWECLPPDLCAIAEPLYRATLAGTAPAELQQIYGDRIYHTVPVTVRDDGGAVIAGMIISIDATERYRAELREREQIRALVELRERQRLARELSASVEELLRYIAQQAQAARTFIAGEQLGMATASLNTLLGAGQEAQRKLRAFGRAEPSEAASDSAEPADLTALLRQQLEQLEQLERRPEALSTQQIKVLTLLAAGHTYKEIGRLLGYSERAIKYHAFAAIKKLHLHSRAEAVAYARRQIQRGAWAAPDVE